MTGPRDAQPAAGGTFDAAWLDARVAADDRARDAGGLAARLRGALGRPGTAGATEIRVLDLGGGTGANLRHLAPRLGGPQRWLVVDRDPALLARVAPGRVPPVPGDVRVDVARVDVASAAGLDALTPWADADVVTSSALFDLAAADVIEALAARLRPRAWLAALEVDGTVRLEPADARDDAVLDAFRADQRRAKGLSLDPAAPALGPDAPDALARALAAAGYRVETAATPWRLDTAHEADRRLCAAWLDGVAGAAARAAPDATATVQAWRAARAAEAAVGGLRVRVGHRDVLGVRA